MTERKEELAEDILVTNHYMNAATDIEVRIAFTRLLEILTAWKIKA